MSHIMPYSYDDVAYHTWPASTHPFATSWSPRAVKADDDSFDMDPLSIIPAVSFHFARTFFGSWSVGNVGGKLADSGVAVPLVAAGSTCRDCMEASGLGGSSSWTESVDLHKTDIHSE